jgi:hypothetical protein
MLTFNFPEYYYMSAFDYLVPVVRGLPLILLADTLIVLDVVIVVLLL